MCKDWMEDILFYAPVSIDRGYLIFALSVRLSVCLVLCLYAKKNLKSTISFEW